MSRRLARELPLPQSEVLLLQTLDRRQLLTRVHALYNEGWTLSAIGSAFTPPKGRSTVQAWVDQNHTSSPVDVPIPSPTHKTPKNGYQRLTPKSPGVPPITAEELRRLAPIAKQYRSRTPSSSRPAIANALMDQIVKDLRANNVSIADIARAAGVTHRAIAKRLGRLGL
jgi:hypothetical protein